MIPEEGKFPECLKESTYDYLQKDGEKCNPAFIDLLPCYRFYPKLL